MKNYLLLLLCLVFSVNTNAQGISINTPDALESYTLLEASNTFYLINNCGEIIHDWNLPGIRHHAKLLPTGKLLYINFATSTIVEKNWDGSIHVSYPVTDPDRYLNYEVIKMPNGNYLCAGRRRLSLQEFDDLGWDDNTGNPLEVDVVIEYDPNLDEVVWEWNIAEHAIQEVNSNGSTYGVVDDHPELLDISAISTYDWENQESFMINGMDYNPDLDQIALSVRKIGEVVIIDHSTTKEEVRGHTGGKHGKGGDIIYRWGDPANYGRATADQQKELSHQHNPKWITTGVHKGKISIYNNLLATDFNGQAKYSSAVIIDPPMDANGFYFLEGNKPYGPVEPTLRIDRPSSNTQFRSDYGSGVAVLPNENIFISNATGRLMEVNTAGEIQWEYQIPFTNFVFRCEKYPKDYVGFSGQDLASTGDQIPGAIFNEECLVVKNPPAPKENLGFLAYYNSDHAAIQIENPNGWNYDFVLYSLEGKAMAAGQSVDFVYRTNVDKLATGMYVVVLQTVDKQYRESIKVIVP